MNDEANEVQTFVAQATERHPNAVRSTRSPQASWIDRCSAQPWNWLPKNALDRIRTSDDPQITTVNIVIEMMEAALTSDKWEDEPMPALPDNPMAAQYVTGTLERFEQRLVKGHIGEALGEEYLNASGKTVVDAATLDKFDSTTEAEKAGVDLVTSDGATYQVKAYETTQDDRDDMNADWLLEVVNGTVNRYKL